MTKKVSAKKIAAKKTPAKKSLPDKKKRPTKFTIGVFDSGVGGLTVLRALIKLAPGARFIYLGDTARLPYGSKSRATVVRYTERSAKLLESRGAQLLVIACNTASALALDDLKHTASVPVIGVVQPGAEGAAAASRTRDVIVLATHATVQSGAYARACAAHHLRTVEKACPLLVPLVEEGWTDHSVTQAVLRIYLMEAIADAAAAGLHPDVVLLGCTHYPLLRGLMEQTVSQLTRRHAISVVDSADATAARVAKKLPKRAFTLKPGESTEIEFLVTDSVDKFRTMGSRFLGREIGEVEHVDLGG